MEKLVLVPYVKYQRLLETSHKTPAESVGHVPTTTMVKNHSKKKPKGVSDRTVTRPSPKTTLSTRKKKTKETRVALVSPPPPGKRDIPLGRQVDKKLGHKNVIKDWISF